MVSIDFFLKFNKDINDLVVLKDKRSGSWKAPGHGGKRN